MRDVHHLSAPEPLDLIEAHAVCNSLIELATVLADNADASQLPRAARAQAALVAQLGEALAVGLPPLDAEQAPYV